MVPSLSPSRRVLVLSADSTLFEEGLTHILTARWGLLVKQEIYHGIPRLLDALYKNQPDVLLVSESDTLDMSTLLDLFPAPANLRVVCVRLDTTLIDIHEFSGPTGHALHRQYNISNQNELFQVLQSPGAMLSQETTTSPIL